MARGTSKWLTVLLLGAAGAGAANLNPATAKAWDEYVASAHAQMKARLGPTACFLWAEEDAGRMARLRAGEIVIAPDDPQTPRHIPGGLIHHWIGAMLIPNVTLPEVLAGIRDYPKYTRYYPSVIVSKLLATEGAVDRFTSIERHQAMFSTRIALDADFTAEYVQAGEKRAYSESSTTRLQQIDSYGSASQHELGPMAPSAYVWALSTISRYEERDGGVYLELEAMALSRDIPMGLHWLVEPFVRKASVSAMDASLKETRDIFMTRRPAENRPFAGAISFR